jgi:hypothetical protein
MSGSVFEQAGAILLSGEGAASLIAEVLNQSPTEADRKK